MTTNANGYIDVRGDGRVVLYKRANLKKPKWQARISVPNARGYKVISTRQVDLDEAKRFALNLYEDLYLHVKSGGQLRTRTFSQVYEEWKSNVETHGRTRRDGSWEATFQRVAATALQFFGAKRIDAIGGADFSEYWAWRRENYRKKPPSNATLKREKTSIMPIFKFAVSKCYISKIPETNTPLARSGRRPTFTRQEWRAIEDASIGWVSQASEMATYRDRYYARACFVLLAHTGLRIGELRQVRWRDLTTIKGKDEQGEATEYLVVNVAKGKTGAREAVFQPGFEVIVKRLYLHRKKELESQSPSQIEILPDRDEPILCHPDGRPIREYKHAFKSLLAFAKIPADRDGKARTIYSLRHYYATQRLTEETNPFLLAHQMGTSVEMLEQHYGQVISRELAAQITRRKPSRLAVKTDTEFPF